MASVSELKIIKKFESSQDSLVLQSSDLSLETIAQMVSSGAIDISPHYQRRERWHIDAQAGLIESFLLNVPVPPVYLAEDDFGTYSVIDGKQRITAIHGFLRDKFSLDGLSRFSEVNGMMFKNLPKPLQNALSIRPYLRVVTLLKQTDPELKYEVFTRLNTGGQPLLPQEIRNALYRGSLNDELFRLAENEFLLKQLKIKTKSESVFKEMTDIEVVLRFLALNESWRSFSGDMRRNMDDFMAKNRRMKQKGIKDLKSMFDCAISRCEALWGGSAFRRYTNNNFRDQFLASIYDAEMISIYELSDSEFETVMQSRTKVIAATKRLFQDNTFEEAVRVSTNTPSRVRYRIEKVGEMLREFL